MLLLQESDLEVKDNKGTKNLVAYHMSRIINDEVTKKEKEIVEEFLYIRSVSMCEEIQIVKNYVFNSLSITIALSDSQIKAISKLLFIIHVTKINSTNQLF